MTPSVHSVEHWRWLGLGRASETDAPGETDEEVNWPDASILSVSLPLPCPLSLPLLPSTMINAHAPFKTRRRSYGYPAKSRASVQDIPSTNGHPGG